MLATFGLNPCKKQQQKNTQVHLIKMHTQDFYYNLTVSNLNSCKVKTQYMKSQTEVKFTVTIHT